MSFCHTPGPPQVIVRRPFLYKENHAVDAWFKKAYGDEEKSLLRL